MKALRLITVCMLLSVILMSCSKALFTETQTSITDTSTSQSTQAPSPITLTNTFENPVLKANNNDIWNDGGFGDPFVMRWNGRYYLYCSATPNNKDVHCWTSDNLVNWKYEGVCAAGLKEDAFAPEVVYYNGLFYMYTSPGGNGHYILKSSSPLGPFTAVSDNLGLSIDGSVFIDDDGSWYFYSAGYKGIRAYPMLSPEKIDTQNEINTCASLGGWTEGPMVVKYNDVYYMTFTGNHVWSPGYRISYSASTSSPVSFTPARNTPLLLCTDKNEVMGIGHSSTVLGPNLDEYYIVYHSYSTIGIRNMNMDRLVFNGDGTVALGPTTDKQQAPTMPSIYSRFESSSDLVGWSVVGGNLSESGLTLSENGMALSNITTQSNYTAEYNLLSVDGQAGYIFGYTDKSSYGKAIYDSATDTLTVTFTVNGAETTHKVKLSASFGEDLNNNALIRFTLKKSENTYTFSANDRRILVCDSSLGKGSIGVFCEKGQAVVGFVGASDHVWQSSLKNVYKPTESTIPAITCVQSAAKTVTHGTASYLCFETDHTYKYLTNTQKNGTYDLTLTYRSMSDCTIVIYQNDTKIGRITLPRSHQKDSYTIERGLSLKKGCGSVSLRVESGNAEVLSLSFHGSVIVKEQTYDFSKSITPFLEDGIWYLAGGKLNFVGNFGKYVLGSENWGNYTVETVITPTSNNINAGLCVRVSNPSDSGEGRDPANSTDWLQGYYIGLGSNSVVLGKQNYDWKVLRTESFTVKMGERYRIKAELNDASIRVWVNETLVITYTDTDSPFLHGMVGFRAHDSQMEVDYLTVSPLP